jgi:hypothetical protein
MAKDKQEAAMTAIMLIDQYGEFQVVQFDSARHRHRGVARFAVRDSHKNYLKYCNTEPEAIAKAKAYAAEKAGKIK